MGINSTRDLIASYFGDRLEGAITESDVTVGVTAVKLVAGNRARADLIISNSGAAAVAISTSPAVTATTGMLIPAGGMQKFDWFTYLDLQCAEFWAISSGAGNGVHVVEYNLIGSDS